MGDYRFPTNHSEQILQRLCRTLPGGNTRTAAYYAPYPLALERGQGCLVWDVDGNRFIDLLNNYAALIHGHSHPRINQAITNQLARGAVFPAPSMLHAELAERICERVQSIETLRFTNSGTEAVMMAVRAARAYTGRDKIVIASLGYHGSWEQICVGARPCGPGVPEAMKQLACVVEYNDIESLESAMSVHGDEVAAILLEPVLGAGGIVAGDPAFFAAARRLADRYGCLLVLDEIITFRLAMGGYQTVLDVTPDLTVLGKIIGGGLPVGAFGGRKEVMEVFDPKRPDMIHHSGTFNGNLLTMAAGCVSLDLLTAAEIQRINHLGVRLANLISPSLANEADGRINVCGSLIQLKLQPAVLAAIHKAALEEGVLFGSRGYLNISTAMNAQVTDEVGERFVRAIRRASVQTSCAR